MKERGVSRCGALLVVLLMMIGTLAMLPSRETSAQTYKMWGFVKSENCAGPIDGATVTLTDAHGLDPTFQTGLDGYYEFSVGSGFYQVEVSKDGYFSQEKGPFRFDGDMNMKIGDFCLEPTPSLDLRVSGTILSSLKEPVSSEEVIFNFQTMPEENLTDTFNISNNTVQVSNPPIVYGSYSALWNNATSTNLQLIDSVDYSIDLWTGTATILNGTIASELGSGAGWLNFSYDHAENTSTLANGYISSYQAFKNSIPWPEAGNYELDVETGDLSIISGNFIFGSDILTFDYEYHPTAINGATLKIYNVTKEHLVDQDTSDSMGSFLLNSWAGAFELQAWADGYQPNISSIQFSEDTSLWVLMEPAIRINGWVTDETGSSVVQNVRAYMLCLDPVSNSTKLLTADISGAYYEFNAFPGTFRLYVDADGYQGEYKEIVVSSDHVYDFSLALSQEERTETSIAFLGNDWNKMVVYKNLTLNNDSHLPSLGTPNFGNLALEIDWALGDKNGFVSVPEWSSFTSWLEERGPEFLKTSGFFTTDENEYTLDPSGYNVSVTNDNQHVWINTTAHYTTTGIEKGKETYDLNLKARYDESIMIDAEERTTMNYTYKVYAPYAYELIWNSSTNTDVIGAVEIFIDPKRGGGTSSVVLTLGVSRTGIAIAEVVGPLEGEGELYVFVLPESTPDDYTAILPAETEIHFSAAKSEDPNGPDGKISPYANFSWKFGDGGLGWGMEVTHNYSDPGTGPADYIVNLTVKEPGENETFREIKVRVDARAPHALVWFDSNDYEVKDGKLHIKEDIKFNFGANLSTDLMWDGEDGNITSYEWDFDSDGIADAFTETVETEFFTEPGEYTLNLTIWDWVGHKSENYSKKIYVDDVTPPDASFEILDSNYAVTDFPYEQEIVYFNASGTTDNFSTLENMTFNWTIDDTFKTGLNVSYTFSGPGSYNVNLTVSDEAGNEGYHNITLEIRGNRSLHSHIFIPRESLSFLPESPEVGQTVKIRVNISNTEEGIEATNLSVRFWIKGETKDKEIKGTVKFYDENGTQVAGNIPPGGQLTAEISWTPGSQGGYTIFVNCTVDNEFPNSLDDNKIQGNLRVKEAGYVMPLIVGIFVLLIFIIAIILLIRRKFGARFPRIRKEKRPEKERRKRVKK